MASFLIVVIAIGLFCCGYYQTKEYGRKQVQYEEEKLRMSRRQDLEKTLREGTPAEQRAAREALDETGIRQSSGVANMEIGAWQGLDNDDRVKLETWYYVMNLLEHYDDLTFKPMYQRGVNLFATQEEKERRALKIEVI
jgi:hypothetical protein